MYRPRATPAQVEAAFEAAGFFNVLAEYHQGYRRGGQQLPDDEGYWAVIFFKDNVTADGVRQDVAAVLDSLGLINAEGMDTYAFDWQPEELIQRSGTTYLPGESLERTANESEEIDPKGFIEKTHRQVADHREVEIAFEADGFSDVNLVPVWRAEDPYWMIYATAMGDQARVEAKAREVLSSWGLYLIEMKGARNGDHWTVYMSVPIEQIDTNTKVAETIVAALIEDVDADLPSHKSEVRILPTKDPRRFDVTLLTGFNPIYIGTLGHQGSLWKPVEVMPGVGRQLRSKLHFVGPDKEAVAMTMVQTLRPIWKRQIDQHLYAQLESEEVDPKEFVTGRKWDFDLASHKTDDWSKWWKPGNWYRYRSGERTFVVTFKGGQRPNRKWGVSVTRPGRGNSFEITEITADELADAAEEGTWIAEKFYARIPESADGEVDPKAFIFDKVKYVYIVREADHMAQWLNKTAWPKQKLETAVTAVFRHKQNALNYASNMGGRVYTTTEDAPVVKAWLSTGQPIRESDEVDPKEFAAARHFNIEGDIKRIIETNYPNIEVVSVENKTGDGYSMKYEAQIRSRDGNQLWHSPIYNLIQDIEVKLADVYGWKLRPYKNQKNYPEFRRTGKPVGIKPIGVSYNNTSTPGQFVLYFDFAIMKRSPDGRGDFDKQPDWDIPYGSPGEQEHNESIQESSKAEIEKEAAKVEAPASPEQAEAGNYKKGHVSVQGLEIAIENAEGSTRSGTGKDGKKWSVTMPAHYGYIKGTQGKDKDHLDVYIGPKPNGMMVFVVNQKKEEGGFDEHKIMLGFETKDEAIATYDRAFSGDLGPKLRETVVSTTVDKLKEWLASGNTKKPFEGLAESLIEAEEEFGLEDFKALALRAGEGAQPGTQFHIGFAIHTSNQHDIEMRANDDAIEVDWEAVNAAIPIIERNVMAALNEQGIRCRGEGHNDDELVGSAWVEAGTGAVAIIKEFVDRDEPFSTSSGNIDHIQQGLGLRAYQGVPENIAMLIDVSVSFFDLDTVKQDSMDGGLGLGESDEIDPKSMAMRTAPQPRVWGDLKPGDVIFDHETGTYERIEGYRDGYGQNYQDASGQMHYDSRPVKLVLYSQFGPAYAYGHFVQRLSSDPRHALFGAELVELPDNSDETLWKLVDEEMIRNGRTAEEIEQSRAEHRARQAARTPEELDAQRRYDQMMGRVPEPPVEESEEIDPKAFLGSHELPVELVPIHANAWQVIRRDDNLLLGQLHFDLHDDAPSPEAAANWQDTNWIAMPITPSVEPRGFKDQDEAIRFLLANGNR
jgi:hypothetical protein